MRIIFLSQYFPPETGAPQNRLYSLANGLQNKGAKVYVLTAMPNYPQMKIYDGYRNKFFKTEIMNELEVYRSWIFVSKNKSIFSRLVNYFSFVISSFFAGLFKLPKADYLICESPPLFLGITALLLSKLKGTKLIFNVSDLWPESAEKLGLVKNKLLLKVSKSLEEFIYKKSFFITGQTQGIVNNISSRFPDKNIYKIPNGADFTPLSLDTDNDWRLRNGFAASDILFLYAGIIGHAQGLEVIIKAADLLKSKPEIKFILLGNGPVKNYLVNLTKELNTENVFFFDTVSKSEMPEIINSVDAGIIPLKKLDLFLGAIPSKIFDLLAMKKPILLGVDGEARKLFIDEGKCGFFFDPENTIALEEKIRILAGNNHIMKLMGENGFNYVQENFNRNKIIDYFYECLKGNK